MTTPMRPAIVCVLAVVLLACGAPVGSPASSSAAATTCPPTPAPAVTPEGWDVSTQRPTVYPTIINPSASIACGPTRLMVSFLDAENNPIAAPDRSAEVRFFDLGADASKPVAEGDATFIWAQEPRVGVYVLDVVFPTSGAYGAEFTTAADGAPPEVIRATFDVQPSSTVTSVGDKAPASTSPTLAAKEPFVVAFATPKFCVSQQCGPTLDRLKPIAARHPEITFINVEPYQLELVDGQLQPVLTGNALTPTKVTEEWGLPTEPWVFVVDKDGIVTDSFMLIFSDKELEEALAALG